MCPLVFRPLRGRVRLSFAALAAPALLSIGCVAYEPAPLDPERILADLEAVRYVPAPASDDSAPTGAPGPEQLAAFAVEHNPALRAARAELGVARALLVEAGLLPDPELGWDGMDALASQITEGTATSVDFVSGFGISLPLLRPGERSARKGAARWRAEAALCALVAAEWQLARDVHLACEEVRVSLRLLEQSRELVEVARGTYEYFERSRLSGASTAIEANLARSDLLAVRARVIRIEARLLSARQELAGLLGLPPDAAPELAPDGSAVRELPAHPSELVELGLQRRPDLSRLLASYAAAEEELRLEVARQIPAISIGTGLTLVPGLFSRFNRAAIETALARRVVLACEVEAAVHALRREVHGAWAALAAAQRETLFLERELVPNAERSLALVRQAFAVGEVTLLQILIVQRDLVDVRTRAAEARAERDARRWQLLAAAGLLAPESTRPEEGVRP